MPKSPRYRIGNVGDRAIVQQGQYLYNVTVEVKDAAAAEALFARLETMGERPYSGPVLRRLDRNVLVNRRGEIDRIVAFLEQSPASILFIVGIAGVGKSALARAAVELRREDAPAVWVACESKSADQLLDELNRGLSLKAGPVLRDPTARPPQLATAVVGAMKTKSLVVLDGFEALLDDAGGYREEIVAALMTALAEVEHRAKVLVPTRRLPDGVGTGDRNIAVESVRGLATADARALFADRADCELAAVDSRVPANVFARIGGHPKFIELLATVVHELPLAAIEQDLLKATNIGGYIIKQVLSTLTGDERAVLHAARVCRDVFSFEALASVYGALNPSRGLDPESIRVLIRRAILEPVGNPVTSYFVHSIIREASAPAREIEAAAHAAAAQWNFRHAIDPSDSATWEEGLYHLRLAASTGAAEPFLSQFRDFLMDHAESLIGAGWGERVLTELIECYDLTKDPGVYFQFAIALYRTGRADAALETIGPIAEGHRKMLKTEEDRSGFVQNLVLLDGILGSLATGYHEDAQSARTLLKELRSLAPEAPDPLRLKWVVSDLAFNLARLEDQAPPRLLTLARRALSSAKALVARDGEDAAAHELAQAHFYLSRSLLRVGDDSGDWFHQMKRSLEINLAHGRMLDAESGVHNCGGVMSQAQPVAAGALLLAWTQMCWEFYGMERGGSKPEIIRACVDQLLESPERIEEGRQYLRDEWVRLVDFFERGLSRRSRTTDESSH